MVEICFSVITLCGSSQIDSSILISPIRLATAGINNAGVIQKVIGDWNERGTSGAFETGAKSSPNYVEGDPVHDLGAHIRNYMYGAEPYCSDNVFGTDPIWSCSLTGQKAATAPMSMGVNTMNCCKALHTMIAIDAHAGKNGMGPLVPMLNNACPAHGTDYGGCVEGTKNQPTEIAEVNVSKY